jgi:hypothetical protein
VVGDGRVALAPQFVDPLRGQTGGDACAVAVGGDHVDWGQQPQTERLVGKGVADVEGGVLHVALGLVHDVDDLDHPRLTGRLARVSERSA